jgi:hypothetical protein
MNSSRGFRQLLSRLFLPVKGQKYLTTENAIRHNSYPRSTNITMMWGWLSTLSLIFLLLASVESLSLQPYQARKVRLQAATVTNDRKTDLSRLVFVQNSLAIFIGVSPAFAKDENAKGTKQDPAFEACLSNCMYNCLKPKGLEQKSRSECLPECKAKCATTKAQLMLGTPIKKE